AKKFNPHKKPPLMIDQIMKWAKARRLRCKGLFLTTFLGLCFKTMAGRTYHIVFMRFFNRIDVAGTQIT
ncbi:MAG: hypothetical protein ABIG61_14650, partial [Planctomycetota bacterium]